MLSTMMCSALTVFSILCALIAGQAEAFYVPTSSIHNDTNHLFGNQLNAFPGPLLGERAPFAPTTGGYAWQNFYELHQFENAPTANGVKQQKNYEDVVHTSVLHCMAILLSALNVFDDQLAKGGIDNPSLRRYGPVNFLGDQWLAGAHYFIQLFLDVLGQPLVNGFARAQCLPQIDKLQFWYGNPPKEVYENGECGAPGLTAYFFKGKPGHKNGIAFCEYFFSTYKSLDHLDKSQFGPAIEFGDRWSHEQPTYFTARVLLHELMHYYDIYVPVFRAPFSPEGYIMDIHLRDDHEEGRTWVAYGAFMAMKASDPTWNWVTAEKYPRVIPAGADTRNTFYNADNLVYMFTEIYLKEKYGLVKDWQDPPDNRQFALRVPPPAPRQARAESSPPTKVTITKFAAANQASATREADQFDIINTSSHEFMVTALLPDQKSGGFLATPRYGSQCPLCRTLPSNTHTTQTATHK